MLRIKDAFTASCALALVALATSCGGDSAVVECGPGTLLDDDVCVVAPDDAGARDAGGSADLGADASAPDAGPADAELADAGEDDAARGDAGASDASEADAGVDVGEDLAGPLRACKGLDEGACAAREECVPKYGVDIQGVVDAMPPLCPTLEQDLTAYEENSSTTQCPLPDTIISYWRSEYALAVELLGVSVLLDAPRELILTGTARAAVSLGTTYDHEYGSTSLNGFCPGVAGGSSTPMGSADWAEGAFEGARILSADAPPTIQGPSSWSAPPSIVFDEARPLNAAVARAEAVGLIAARLRDGFDADGVAAAWDTPAYAGCAARRFCTGPEGTIWGRPESGGACTTVNDGCLPLDWEPCAPEPIPLRLDPAACTGE
jgi:hypothetical protein